MRSLGQQGNMYTGPPPVRVWLAGSELELLGTAEDECAVRASELGVVVEVTVRARKRVVAGSVPLLALPSIITARSA